MKQYLGYETNELFLGYDHYYEGFDNEIKSHKSKVYDVSEFEGFVKDSLKINFESTCSLPKPNDAFEKAIFDNVEGCEKASISGKNDILIIGDSKHYVVDAKDFEGRVFVLPSRAFTSMVFNFEQSDVEVFVFNKDKEFYAHNIVANFNHSKGKIYNVALSLSRSFMRNHVYLGYGSHIEVEDVIFAHNKDFVMNTTNIIHKSPESHSSADVRVLSFDNAKVIQKGISHITEQAKNSSAYVNELALQYGGKIETLPAMKIDNLEVSAGHGAANMRFDEEHVFYLMSRGLSKKQSLLMLIEGFMAHAFDGTIKEFLMSYLDRVLRNKL